MPINGESITLRQLSQLLCMALASVAPLFLLRWMVNKEL